MACVKYAIRHFFINNNQDITMILKTYGVSNLMSWRATIKAGQATVIVNFTGGALTAYGVTPAEYSTSNPFYQAVIENSDYFKNGHIHLLREVEVPDDAATKARKAQASRRAAQQAEKVAAQQAAAQQQAKQAEQPAETTESDTLPAGVTVEISDGKSEDAEADGESDSDGVQTIEVADKAEAVEYLKEHFADKGYTSTSLRTKAAFEAACKECGVEFVFTTE